MKLIPLLPYAKISLDAFTFNEIFVCVKIIPVFDFQQGRCLDTAKIPSFYLNLVINVN